MEMLQSSCLRLLLFNFIFVCHFQSIGQVKIWGTAVDYPGEYMVVHSLSDAITNQKIFINKFLINEKGEFNFSIAIDQTRPLYISVGSSTGLLFVEPNGQYHINFPKPDQRTFQKFEGTEIILGLVGIRNSDLNLSIRRFNEEYARFIQLHYYDFASSTYTKQEGVVAPKKNLDKEEKGLNRDSCKKVLSHFPDVVVEFKLHIDSIFGTVDSGEYFDEYVEFSISEVELLAGLNRKDYYEAYFMSRNLNLLNPAVGSAFRLFYNGYLANSVKSKQNEWIKAVNLEASAVQCLKVFELDSLMPGEMIRAMVCINSLREFKSPGILLEPKILQTLEDFEKHFYPSSVANLARNVRLLRMRYQQGWPLEDFTLLDVKGNKWTWSAQQAKTTYFLCFATWSTASLKELALLSKLQIEFGDAIDIVAICMDRDPEMLKKYMSENRDMKFNFLLGNADPLLAQKLNMRSIPHAVLIDGEGNYANSFTRRPSEGVRLDFEKYMALLKSQQKSGAKTWRE
jgi:thiol-disulfide isomerase/thioredoxin